LSSFGQLVCVAVLAIVTADRFRKLLPIRLQPHESKVLRLACAKLAERAAHQQGAFERQLRREQRVGLRLGWRVSGLVIDDLCLAAVAQVATIWLTRQG